MEPENEPLEEEYPLGTIIFRFHVSFQGCKPFIKKNRQVFVRPTQEDGFSVVFLHIFFGEIWMPSWYDVLFSWTFLVQKASTMLEIPSSNLTRHFGLALWVFADSPGIECFYRFLSESFGLAFVANLFKIKNVPRSFSRVFSSGSIGTRAIRQPPKNRGFFSSFLGIPPVSFSLTPSLREKGREICLASGQRSQAPWEDPESDFLTKQSGKKKSSSRTGNSCGFFPCPF